MTTTHLEPDREERVMGKERDLLSQILTHGPSQNTIFLILTEMKQEGQYGKVIQECLRALNTYPGDIRLMTLLAESYLEAGFIGLCESELNKITREIEKQAFVFKLQAQIYEQQERFEAAVASLKKYLALNPDDHEAIDQLDRVLQQEARSLFEKTLPGKTEGQPDSTDGEADFAEDALSIESPENETQAEETPGDAAETAADGAEGALIDLASPTLAELYFSQGQYRKAIETYEKWILNNPDDKNAEQRLNEMWTGRDERTDAASPTEDPTRMKTEKSIAILERWLTRLQK